MSVDAPVTRTGAASKASRTRARQPLDVGRVVLTPLMAYGLLTNAASLLRWRLDQANPAVSVLHLTATVLIGAFYGLLVVTYLRRLPAKATSRSAPAAAAAAIATVLPIFVPVAGTLADDRVGLTVGSAMLVLGMAFAVWGLRHLGRSFSILAQARALVTDGPYRLVRHPLYTGEIVATLGITLVHPSPVSAALAAVFIGLQHYRSTHEERVLTSTFPEYREYAQQVGRLVPGVDKARG